VTLRFFAAARSAAGASERAVVADSPLTISDALDATRTASPDYDAIMARCSFLVNAIATTDRDRVLADGDVLDVLPPFAGG